MNSELLNQILDVALKALITVLVAGLAGVAKAYFDRLRAQVGNEKWEFAEKAARIAVSYAEQLGLTDAAKNAGATKKALALEALQAALDVHNIKLDAKSLEALIEAQVFESFNKWKGGELAVPVTAAA